MKTVIYTADANPAAYCETHAVDAIAILAENNIAYSAEFDSNAAECITCLALLSQAAVAAAQAAQSV